MTLKELIKMMKSKRLPADRRQFHQLGWFSKEHFILVGLNDYIFLIA